MEQFNFTIRLIQFLLITPCFILYSIKGFKKTAPKPLKYITFYLLFYFISETLTKLYSINGWNNHYISHIYFISQFVFLSLFYKSLFTTFQKKIVSILLFSVLLILIIQYTLHPNLLVELNPLEVLLTCSPLVVYTIVHLYNSMSNKNEYMYINAGILFYLSISTLIFILFKYLNSAEFLIVGDPMFLINKLLIISYMIIFIVEYKQTVWKIQKK